MFSGLGRVRACIYWPVTALNVAAAICLKSSDATATHYLFQTIAALPLVKK